MSSILAGLGNWLDNRTGYRQQLHEALYENIPGGSRWIYVTGSMLVFAFVTQLVTGVFLWMCYSPGSQNAWESVFWIQNRLQGGWLLRGVHHSMAQAMIVLMPLHVLQVVLCKAYVKPREINFWLGLVLMLLVLALGLTGYLLPWDQKGFWATKVATELMSLPPGGAYLQQLVVGGREYGHYTLTRFFAFHAGVLPALLCLFLALHVAMFRRHGITAKSSASRTDEFFWPRQVLKDSIACLFLLVVVVASVVWEGGPELGPPAEPTESYGAARPEWYYLFLFQLLKYAPTEFIGAIVIPAAVMAFLFLMPFVGKVRIGHFANVIVLLGLFGGAAYLTYEARDHDNYANKDLPVPEETAARLLHIERVEASRDYLLAKEMADREYERVTELVDFFGIPRQGVSAGLIRNDPEIQGPRIFVRNCGSCHSYLDEDGHGIPGPSPPRDSEGNDVPDPGPYGAPNLFGIGTRVWLLNLLDPEKIAGDDFFGLTKHRSGDMVQFVQDELSGLDEGGQQRLQQIVIALSAEVNLLSQADADGQSRSDGTVERGVGAIGEAIDAQACTDCHKFHDEGDLGVAPDLTGYGSYRWLYDFIANPSHERFYGEEGNDRMQAYGEHPEDASLNLLTDHEIDMLVRWLRGDDRHLARVPQTARDSTVNPELPDTVAPPDSETPQSTETDESDPVEPDTADTEPVGMRLFRRRCARCHAHANEQGEGIAGPRPRASGAPNGAPNLYQFASREWLTGLLDPERVGSNDYLGNTAFREGDMVGFVHDMLVDLDDEQTAALSNVIAALSAEAALPSQAAADASASEGGTIAMGAGALVNEFACTDCHRFHDDGELGMAPDLTGYGSREWLMGIISDPAAERFYPESNDRMPAFAPHADSPEANRLSPEEMGSLVRWIRGEADNRSAGD